MTIHDLAESLGLRVVGHPYVSPSTMTVTFVNARSRERTFMLSYPLTDAAIAVLKKALADW